MADCVLGKQGGAAGAQWRHRRTDGHACLVQELLAVDMPHLSPRSHETGTGGLVLAMDGANLHSIFTQGHLIPYAMDVMQKAKIACYINHEAIIPF